MYYEVKRLMLNSCGRKITPFFLKWPDKLELKRLPYPIRLIKLITCMSVSSRLEIGHFRVAVLPLFQIENIMFINNVIP